MNDDVTPEPVITDDPEQRVALIALQVPAREIRQHMNSALEELTRTLEQQHRAPSGPWFTYHHRRPTDTFDFEVCFPVDDLIVPSGRVQNGVRRAATVVRTIHNGSYDKLIATWQSFGQWIAQNGYVTSTDLWEVYTVGPRNQTDPAEWRTELNWPLATTAVKEQA